MDDLILASLQGTIAPADAARLEAWRRASPSNEAHYRDLARVWTLTAREDPLVAHASPAPTPDEILARRFAERSAGRPAEAAAPAAARARRRWRGWPPGVAAIAAIAAAAAAALLLVTRPSADGPGPAGVLSASEFVTDTSEMVTARLDDGSVVRLAAQSRMRVFPVANRREVWLDGHAFFAIAPDSARPFTIRTRAGDVEVLGTRFDLRVDGAELLLVVTEGRVALAAGDGRRLVRAGETAHVVQGSATVGPTVRADSLLGWMGGFLAFQNTPLRQVARELEQRFDVRILLPDSALAARTVTAWFTGQEFPQVLDAVCRVVDAHCTLRDGVASIEP